MESNDELLVYEDKSGDWGMTPRNRGCREASGDFLLFMDDDDIYLPDAFATIRAAVSREPDRLHIFRMERRYYSDHLWTERVVKKGNVSTQMFAVPNVKDKLGDWELCYDGDYEFLKSTLTRRGDEPVWHEDVIAVWRPGPLHVPGSRCPDQDLCNFIGRHMPPRLCDIWYGRNIDRAEADKYRRLWLNGRSMVNVPENLQPRLQLTPSELLLNELAAKPLHCLHLGDKTGERIECLPCGGKTRFLVHACAIHGRCVPASNKLSVPACGLCPDIEPRHELRLTRHLAYHVCPLPNPVWQTNLDMLRSRIGQFSGRRLIGVVTGPGIEAPDLVRQALAGLDCEFIVRPNGPAGEVVTFRDMLPILEKYRGESDAIFYGHAKGVRRPWDVGSAVPDWVRLLYEVNLDYPALVEEFLQRFPVCGAFKKTGHAPWHYVGAFWWVRSRDLFSRNWQALMPSWGGTEFYPGHQFTEDEGGCLFGEGGSNLILYQKPLMDSLVREYDGWKTSMRRYHR